MRSPKLLLTTGALISTALLAAGCSNPDTRDDSAAETTAEVTAETTTDTEDPDGVCGPGGDSSEEACAPGESSSASETSESESASASSTTSSAAAADVASAIGNHPVTVTSEAIIVGDPEATNIVKIYEDFNCPHCVELHKVLSEDGSIDRWIEEGAAVEIIPVNYLGPRTTHDFSGRAAAALNLVATKYPDKLGDAQAALFNIRPETTTTELSDSDIMDALEKAGVELTAADGAALAGGEHADWVNGVTESAAKAGVNYIPQVWVNDELIEKDTPEEVVDAVTFN